MRVYLLLVAAFMSTAIFCQDLTDLTSSDVEWSEGSIMLSDNSELTGLVRYNDKTGVLSYQKGNDSRSFTPRSVIAFEFFDEALMRQRLFYSLDYEDRETQMKRPYFFEVMKDYNDFALVSKTDPLEFKKERGLAEQMLNPQGYPLVIIPHTNENETIYREKIGIYQVETIYLFDLTNLSINPVVEISNKTVDRLILEDKTRVKDKIVGKDYLKKFLGSSYKLLMEYADQQALKPENKNDLIKIFDYYVANLK